MDAWRVGVGRRAAVAGSLLVAGCAQPAPGAASPVFADKLWRVADGSGIAPGAFYLFLNDGTLLITSPQGTPLVGSWSLSADTLRVVEEGIPYPATIVTQEEERFGYILHGPGEPLELRFVRERGSRG